MQNADLGALELRIREVRATLFTTLNDPLDRHLHPHRAFLIALVSEEVWKLETHVNAYLVVAQISPAMNERRKVRGVFRDRFTSLVTVSHGTVDTYSTYYCMF